MTSQTASKTGRVAAHPGAKNLSVLQDKSKANRTDKLQAADKPVAGKEASNGSSSDLTAAVGANLRRLRTRRGLSLERLAHASGVSRAMLSQIELGRSTPTLRTLWKIAYALNKPFSALIMS